MYTIRHVRSTSSGMDTHAVLDLSHLTLNQTIPAIAVVSFLDCCSGSRSLDINQPEKNPCDGSWEPVSQPVLGMGIAMIDACLVQSLVQMNDIFVILKTSGLDVLTTVSL